MWPVTAPQPLPVQAPGELPSRPPVRFVSVLPSPVQGIPAGQGLGARKVGWGPQVLPGITSLF